MNEIAQEKVQSKTKGLKMNLEELQHLIAVQRGNWESSGQEVGGKSEYYHFQSQRKELGQASYATEKSRTIITKKYPLD